jgi:hypothetical protein
MFWTKWVTTLPQMGAIDKYEGETAGEKRQVRGHDKQKMASKRDATLGDATRFVKL